MLFPKTKFLKTATELSHFPEDDLNEFVIMGRSNSGKSSLINLMCGANLAKTSSTPGHTAALQIFEIKDKFRFVDVPGYGWASRSHEELKTWNAMIANYLENRGQLKAAVIIQDCRRPWSELEAMAAEFLFEREIPWAWVLSKIDKLNSSEFRTLTRTTKERVEHGDPPADAAFFVDSFHIPAGKSKADFPSHFELEKWLIGHMLQKKDPKIER